MELLLGIVIGVLLGAFLFRRRPVGDLRIDRSDSAGRPYLFLELDTDVQLVSRKKRVTFRVRNQDFLPHE